MILFRKCDASLLSCSKNAPQHLQCSLLSLLYSYIFLDKVEIPHQTVFSRHGYCSHCTVEVSVFDLTLSVWELNPVTCDVNPAGRVRSPPLRRWGLVAQQRWPGCRSVIRLTRRRVTTPSRSPTACRPTPEPLTSPDKVKKNYFIFIFYPNIWNMELTILSVLTFIIDIYMYVNFTFHLFLLLLSYFITLHF